MVIEERCLLNSIKTVSQQLESVTQFMMLFAVWYLKYYWVLLSFYLEKRIEVYLG